MRKARIWWVAGLVAMGLVTMGLVGMDTTVTWRTGWDWIVYKLSRIPGQLGSETDGMFRLITILAGIAAFLLAVWRSMIADKQAKAAIDQAKNTTKQIDAVQKQISISQEQVNTTVEQVKIAQKGQYSDRFVKAVEQVADDRSAVRLGGLASLRALSGETKEEYERVWNYLGNFLRYLPVLNDWPPVIKAQKPKEERQIITDQRPDIVAIAIMIKERDPEQIKWQGGFHLPLSKAKLKGANLQEANLQNADMQDADLRKTHLQKADLRKANLQKANLRKVNLREANMQGADLRWANLQKADLQEADLQGVLMQKVDLQEANLQGADLTFALFNSTGNDPQDLTRCTNLTPDQMKETFHRTGTILPTLPEWKGEPWPEDCQPQPIPMDEWNDRRNEWLLKQQDRPENQQSCSGELASPAYGVLELGRFG